MADENDDRERTEGGQYAPGSTTQATETDVLDAVRSASDPVVTVGEVAEAVGTSRDTALRRLRALHESGDLERKEVGARAVVWWSP
jgi:predicted ArsR family transcriptional regulator